MNAEKKLSKNWCKKLQKKKKVGAKHQKYVQNSKKFNLLKNTLCISQKNKNRERVKKKNG